MQLTYVELAHNASRGEHALALTLAKPRCP